jgi:GrpB-like predicted nucleotidyltransferase (UPF0157 family)
VDAERGEGSGMDEQTTPVKRMPLTEEQIRAATVGETRRLVGRLRIVEYDASWPELFEREAARIRAVLGERALRIEHTGSTSVPGLAAKPIVDMLLVVADSANEATYLPDLESAGYVLRIREPDWYEHRVFKGPDTDVNLHVLTIGCEEIDKIVLFRDWLRAHPADRELYEQTKRALVQRDWQYTQQYADAKTEVIEAIIARARAHVAGHRFGRRLTPR